MRYFLLLILLFPTHALAVDDATVQAIDTKASSANSKADGNNSRIQALEAEDIILHQRIDSIQLTPGPKGDKGDPGLPGAVGAQGPQGPAGPPGSASTVQQYQWVGSSTDTGFPNYGPATFSRYCDQTFPGSRMCTTLEVLKTVNPPSYAIAPVAWIHPSLSGHLNAAGETMDLATGLVLTPADMTCRSWSTGQESSSGLVVQYDGKVRTVPCNNSLPAACCAPVQ